MQKPMSEQCLRAVADALPGTEAEGLPLREVDGRVECYAKTTIAKALQELTTQGRAAHSGPDCNRLYWALRGTDAH